MTGKEYHKLLGLQTHFRDRAREWKEDGEREANVTSKSSSDGKATAYATAAKDLEKLLEEMNS